MAAGEGGPSGPENDLNTGEIVGSLDEAPSEERHRAVEAAGQISSSPEASQAAAADAAQRRAEVEQRASDNAEDARRLITEAIPNAQSDPATLPAQPEYPNPTRETAPMPSNPDMPPVAASNSSDTWLTRMSDKIKGSWIAMGINRKARKTENQRYKEALYSRNLPLADAEHPKDLVQK